MRVIQLSIVGFGTVGRWLAAAVERRRAWLQEELGADVRIVGAASKRDGFIYRDEGLDVPVLLDLAARKDLAGYPGALHWDTALEGISETGCDVLAEASGTDPREPEPAASHIRRALARGEHVITSSKGACAAAAVELMALARRQGVRFRMESTVMSGTPVISTICEGLSGTQVLAVRRILNGTANHILTLMTAGMDYPSALADAQARGYAEPDPSDDVEGHDSAAKARILAAVAFGRAVPLEQVTRSGIADISAAEARRAVDAGRRIKLVASITPGEVRVEPIALPLEDPLARVDGVMNAVTIRTDTVREVAIIGPGAGPEQAGQGMFADLIAVIRGR
jgi:homoserine dehydrogenase